jgi:DNA mismatch repair protein MutS
MDVKDLNLATDIAALFDVTLNDEARACLKKMLSTPLPDKESILQRQQVLKGFLANIHKIQSYSYSKIDFREVENFLAGYSDKQYRPKRLKAKLFFSKQKYYRYRGHCIQLILLYNRLYSNYTGIINSDDFPESYKQSLGIINRYLQSFRTGYYEGLVREGKFGIRQIVDIIHIISAKKKSMETDAFRENYSQFEAYLSASLCMARRSFVFPEINGTHIALHDFYHPLLKAPVKNSFETTTNVVLLTGPNMSGKSTLLKAIALCTYLGNTGFAIPASAGRIPFYSDISAYINLNDDLQSGYSHFMGEVLNLKKTVALAHTGVPCLAVFDELFRGTNVDDALEISQATLNGLLKFKNCLFFISSHLHGLTNAPAVKNGSIACYYLDCNVEGSVPRFTYALKPGYSQLRVGRLLFEKEGLTDLLQ